MRAFRNGKALAVSWFALVGAQRFKQQVFRLKTYFFRPMKAFNAILERGAYLPICGNVPEVLSFVALVALLKLKMHYRVNHMPNQFSTYNK